VFLDGAEIDVEAYLIEGRNYFRMRDLAFALSGTPAQFNVHWDSYSSSIVFTSGAAFVTDGSEPAGRSEERKLPEPSSTRVVLDGEEVSFSAYTIEGSYFFWLRDIADAFGFSVDWDEERQAIIIKTIARDSL
jgi:hypothetical protein